LPYVANTAAMFRQVLRRSASIKASGFASYLPAPTSGRSVFVPNVLANTARPIVTSKTHSLLRLYSSEAAQSAQVEEAPKQDGPITKFADLSSLGVNQRLLKTITQGMGFETMTPVQTQTIEAALKGKDM
jgi:ATP-dependent RNA helicase MSS116, mitochondrial